VRRKKLSQRELFGWVVSERMLFVKAIERMVKLSGSGIKMHSQLLV